MEISANNIRARSNTVNILIMIGIIVLIISSISAIIIIKKSMQNHTKKEEILCIASKSEIYISRTCSACAYQKSLIGDYIRYFNMIDCMTETQKCAENEIMHVPSWIINGTKYEGVQSIEKLKELTNC